MPRPRSIPRLVVTVTALLALTVVTGCSAPGRAGVDGPTLPRSRPPIDLSTPEASVRTYLDWTSLAYRMANSDVTSKTASPYENVRVDAYIELNRQKNQGIEQSLESFKVRDVSVEATTATVTTSEDWRYRYFSLDSVRYTSAENRASYEATYTVVKGSTGWLVDKVDARPLTKVE